MQVGFQGCVPERFSSRLFPHAGALLQGFKLFQEGPCDTLAVLYTSLPSFCFLRFFRGAALIFFYHAGSLLVFVFERAAVPL